HFADRPRKMRVGRRECAERRPRGEVVGMVHEGDHHADGDDADAQQHTDAQQRGHDGVLPVPQPIAPLSSICAAMTTRTTTKVMRIDPLSMRPSVRDPANAPAITPTATGAAMNGSICPRET